MPPLPFIDHRQDPAAWARALGVSAAAVGLYLSCDVIDLHLDSFLWTRMAGYDLTRRHGPGLFGGSFYGQVDLPRLREARVTGATWVITTNPLRTAAGRAHAFARNLSRLKSIFSSCPDDVELVRTAPGYRRAVAAGKHAAFIGVQGGNALDRDGRALDAIEGGDVVRVTLVHLTNSGLGATSAPNGRNGALTPAGVDYLRRLDALRVFVDLAHISRRGFWDAVQAHDRSLPLIVTHTGVDGVHRHWRNLDDAQLKAIADTGGTVGVIYQSTFLGDPLFGGRAESIVRHLEHIVQVAGEDCCSLGSDWDGMIVPPRDLLTCLQLPRLVQIMLDRGWPEARVRKALGGNFLRALERLRGKVEA
jgi:membrane dipeptidase